MKKICEWYYFVEYVGREQQHQQRAAVRNRYDDGIHINNIPKEERQKNPNEAKKNSQKDCHSHTTTQKRKKRNNRNNKNEKRKNPQKRKKL